MQIRTHEMHRIAEEGIAAHWKYKEGRTGVDKDDQPSPGCGSSSSGSRRSRIPHEFLNSLKLDLYPEEVYCFTPKGEVKMLPRGASPIDFAYAIHTEVGHQCVGARVNGKMVPLRYKLKNGDIVEILTSAGHKPSRDWLGFTVTNKAKAKIRHYLNIAEKQQALEIGRKHLERELRRYDLSLKKVAAEPAPLEALAQELGVGSRLDDLIAGIGYGKVSARQVLARLLPPDEAPAEGAREATPGRRRRQALPAAQRRADHGQGHGRPPRVPGQVLQPDHGRADRRLHHAWQGCLRPLRQLSERHEPRLRPRAADRRRVGGGGRGRLRGAPLRRDRGPSRVRSRPSRPCSPR